VATETAATEAEAATAAAAEIAALTAAAAAAAAREAATGGEVEGGEAALRLAARSGDGRRSRRRRTARCPPTRRDTCGTANTRRQYVHGQCEGANKAAHLSCCHDLRGCAVRPCQPQASTAEQADARARASGRAGGGRGG